MAEKRRSEIKVKAITKVGIVVRDVEKVARNYWNVLGIGPWDIITTSPELRDRTYRGKPAYFEAKIGFAKVGAVDLVLLEPLEGQSIYRDFLDQRGEGANHIQYSSDSFEDFNRDMEVYPEKGIPVLMSGKIGRDICFAYMDTIDTLKAIWEPMKTGKWPVPVTRYPAGESAESPARIKVKAINQVSLSVKNLEVVMGNYTNLLGIGGWKVYEVAPPTLHGHTYRGRIGAFSMRVALTNVGPIELEIIQPVAGDSVYSDHISKYGEGINHLSFTTDSVEKATEIMEEEGFPLLQSGHAIGNDYFAYFDTVGPLKVIWEAWEPPKGDTSAGPGASIDLSVITRIVK
ncbi:VOC family protein [Chloroflexota bacterium]